MGAKGCGPQPSLLRQLRWFCDRFRSELRPAFRRRRAVSTPDFHLGSGSGGSPARGGPMGDARSYKLWRPHRPHWLRLLRGLRRPHRLQRHHGMCPSGDLGRFWASSAKLGATSTNFGRIRAISASFWRLRPMLVRIRQDLVRVRLISNLFDKSVLIWRWQHVGLNMFTGQTLHRWVPAKILFGQNFSRRKSPELVRNCPKLLDIIGNQPKLSEFAPKLVDVAPNLVEFAQHRPKSPESCPTSPQD